MKTKSEYCPDCYLLLKKDNKKLGHNTIWLKCPNCGFRKRPKTWVEVNQELDEFMRNIHRDINDNIDEDE